MLTRHPLLLAPARREINFLLGFRGKYGKYSDGGRFRTPKSAKISAKKSAKKSVFALKSAFKSALKSAIKSVALKKCL